MSVSQGQNVQNGASDTSAAAQGGQSSAQPSAQHRGPINLATFPFSDAASQQRAKSANAYLRTRVMSASPEELRLLLLEGAVRFARQGAEGLAAKNYEQLFTGLSQARDIVIELLTTIRADVNPELAANVKSLYVFIYQQLVEGSHEKDVAKISKAIELLEYEVETWMLLMQQLAQEKARHGAGAGAPVTPSTDALTAASSGVGRGPLAVQA
jgi:flagellar protein FliS